MQKYISDVYSKYKLVGKTSTAEEVCNKKEIIEHTSYQKFLQEFSIKNRNKGILLYHRMGTGKTLTSILMLKEFMRKTKYNKATVLLPASLRTNYEKNLGKDYSKENIELFAYNTIKVIKDKKNFNNKVVIIDEVQNFISMVKNKSKIGLELYFNIMKSDCKIICLSATPITNNPFEYAILFNMLKPNTFKLDLIHFAVTYIDLDTHRMKNKANFYKKIEGLVSYYNGFDEKSDIFPRTKHHLEKVVMSPEQEKYYDIVREKEQPKSKSKKKQGEDTITEQDILIGSDKVSASFRVKSRMACNSSFENVEEIDKASLKNLKQYSAKFERIIDNVKKSEGPVIVYSNFIETGVNQLEKLLNLSGIKTLRWVGGQTDKERVDILNKFNKETNKDKNVTLLISKAGAEGLSLKNVRQIHITEPHWNAIRMLQITGRGVRLCSHYTLPKEKQLVDVYTYISGLSNKKLLSTDEYISEVGTKKLKIVKDFENTIKQSALDCQLNINQNPDVGICMEDEINLKF
jgi:superfamily II DNA or RNA helicase